jgi:hypothetical protein
LKSAGADGAGDAAGAVVGLNSPGGVAVDRAGTIYLADTGNHIVRKLVFAPPP